MIGYKLYDKMKAVTEGTYVEEGKPPAVIAKESDTNNKADDVVEDMDDSGNANGGAPTEDTLESILHEKDDKEKDDWKDERSHDEAVKQIVKDSWKEIYVDGAFKGDATPTRDEVMTEVEFQSKHGLDHREDASAVRYDAFKKVMKKVKNIQKKLDAEDESTPEEEDTEAESQFQQVHEARKQDYEKRAHKNAKKDKKLQPKPFLGMKT